MAPMQSASLTDVLDSQKKCNILVPQQSSANLWSPLCQRNADVYATYVEVFKNKKS